jgi:hypothetical protein
LLSLTGLNLARAAKAVLCCGQLRPNRSFKPNPLRSGIGVAGKACHAASCAAQVGLTQALDKRR